MIASGFGSGYAPKAPGTAGSLLALVVGAGLLLWGHWALASAALLAVIGGLWAIGPAGGTEDPGWVVIDEFAGQWITLLPLAAPTPLGLLAGFALFRLFDITKPGPIGWADRQHGAFGVMADDVLAGIAAGVIVAGLQWGWPALV